MLDVRGDDPRKITCSQLVQYKVDAVGGIEREGDAVILFALAGELQQEISRFLHLCIDHRAPLVLHPPAAGVILEIVFGLGINDGLGAQSLACGIEIAGLFL